MAAATKVTFVNQCASRQAIKVFYGATQGRCVDKPYRNQFTLEPGGRHVLDIGIDLCCYCYNDEQNGVPPEDCSAQQARPGDTVYLT